MKKKHGLLPVSLYDLGGVESWLEEQERKGWRLVSLRGLVNFEQAEPKAVHYRLAPQMGAAAPTEEQKAVYGEFGWEYVCPTGKNWFFVWRSEEMEPREIHTDPQVEGELLETIYRRQKGLIWTSAVLLLLALAMAGFAVFGHPQPLLRWVETGQGALVLSLLVDIWLVWQMLRDYRAAERLMQAMQTGQPRPHKRRLSWRERYLPYVPLALATVGLVLCAFDLSWLFGVERINLTDYDGPLPTVTLAEIEGDPGLERRPYFFTEDELDWNNYISVRPSQMSHSQLEYCEQATVPGRMWDDNSGAYSPSLTVNYYELRLGFLAKPLLGELLEEKTGDAFYLHEGLTVQQLGNGYFDEAYLLEMEEMKWLLARQGNGLLELRYYGYADLEEQLEEISRKMTDFR